MSIEFYATQTVIKQSDQNNETPSQWRSVAQTLWNSHIFDGPSLSSASSLLE